MSEINVGKSTQTRSGHLYFVQWLRVFLIALVVAHHAAQPYGPTGGEWPIDDPVSSDWLGPFFLFNSAFFMGFFFLISGYFVSGSYDRKGRYVFVRDRIIRLGVPLALISFLVFGFIGFLESGSQGGFVHFFIYQYIGQWQIEMGPLWFLAQLLVLCIFYALWRELMPACGLPEPHVPSVPTDRMILTYAIALGVVGMFVRLFYQQDVWVHILGVIPAEVVHIPQYWSLFVIGVVAGRKHWFSSIAPSLGPKWFVVGLAAFVIALVTHPQANLIPHNMLPQELSLGLLWGVLWGLLEAFVCVGFIIGFLVFFRERISTSSKWLERLDQNVFGVYIIHVFVLVGVQGAILEFSLPALAKFIIATTAGLIISFILVTMLRLIPGVTRVI